MEVLAANASSSINGQVFSANTVNPLLQEALVFFTEVGKKTNEVL